MGNKISTLYIYVVVLYLFLYILVVNSGLDLRIDRLLLIPLILCNLYSGITLNMLKNLSAEVKILNTLINLFVGVYMLSALFYSFNNNSEIIFSYLPTIIVVLPSVSSFILISYFGFLDEKKLFILALIFFLFSVFSFYKVYMHKVDLLGDEFYKHSNNSGYYFVLVSPLIFYVLKRFKIISILALTILFVFVLFAAKRGAIIIYTLSFISYVYAIFRNVSNKYKLIFSIVIISFGIFVLVSFTETIEQLLYRFSLEGGSGRTGIYGGILRSYYDSDIFELIFGHGFFSVLDLTKSIFGFSIMAHSDFLEIILDLGLVGICIYLSIISSVLYYTTKVPKYMFYERFTLKVSIFIWILKATFSGVFMVKDSIILLLTIGVIIGFVEYNKKINEKNTIYCSK